MKISFPYMGPTLIYAKLLELLGHDIVMPNRPSRKTIELGVKHSPEFACFPFKVLMGTYLEMMGKGIDTIVTSGGHGPCRAGYYGELHKKILSSLGYDLDFIIFDEPKRDFKRFFQYVKRLKADSSWFHVARVVYIVYRMSKSIDKIEKIVTSRRAYVSNKSLFNRTWQNILEDYSRIRTLKDISEVEKKALKKINKFNYQLPPEDERIRIGIIGEIYVVMEPSVNNNIEEIINYFGAEVERSQYLSQYIDETIMPFKGKEVKEIFRKADDYLEIIIGGHARQSVGHIVDYKERGFDGIIHLKPFGCLPELITQSMLDKISLDLDIPILSLSIDEQTAQANLMTRIEAFIDFIKYQKASKKERMVVNE